MYLGLALFSKCSVALVRNTGDSREAVSCRSCYRMSELFTGERARFGFVLFSLPFFFNFIYFLALQGKYVRKTFRFLLHIDLLIIAHTVRSI